MFFKDIADMFYSIDSHLTVTKASEAWGSGPLIPFAKINQTTDGASYYKAILLYLNANPVFSLGAPLTLTRKLTFRTDYYLAGTPRTQEVYCMFECKVGGSAYIQYRAVYNSTGSTNAIASTRLRVFDSGGTKIVESFSPGLTWPVSNYSLMEIGFTIAKSSSTYYTLTPVLKMGSSESYDFMSETYQSFDMLISEFYLPRLEYSTYSVAKQEVRCHVAGVS